MAYELYLARSALATQINYLIYFEIHKHRKSFIILTKFKFFERFGNVFAVRSVTRYDITGDILKATWVQVKVIGRRVEAAFQKLRPKQKTCLARNFV